MFTTPATSNCLLGSYVGASGDAFNVSDNTTMTVMDLLFAADTQAVSGLLYNGDTIKKKKANFVFSALNEAGSIG